ncbi:Splicing regulatory glutamine/lysine-rich protein 1 [Tetrabaena socialis]|uniref:Splicing regulatory glutamine/lysine-rich protein 1 n=1 Tax=Tetrabaena socialis TaxID=47790 RepID=A0A2J8A6P9_9CHLO|nr:Splicing regulatory glutamine/lysine-rich protein 1 [Tetrabaena socialis]|eukprot:PNH08163.1 Splicing regulatory glutamine/lysine-rich protein 1 [Tetrabaena socialis]
MNHHGSQPNQGTAWVPMSMAYPPGMMAPGILPPGMVFGPAYGFPSGPMSMPSDGLRGYAAFGGMATMPQEVDAAAALAERLNELQLGGSRRGPPMQQHGPGSFARGGIAGPGPSAGGYSTQSQAAYYYQPGPQVQQGRGRQGRGGGRGGAQNNQSGGRGPGQLQKKKRPQKGLEDNIKRTVYISYVDCALTEENLAAFFSDCGSIADCRICGDPNSAMRFAFIEFLEVEFAQKALEKTGSVLGSSPLRVLPSKTAIMPVNQELMPRSMDEVERCSRTVYAANIDKKVDKNDVRAFFESLCGKVSRIRLLGDYAHSTRIAFVEFHHAEGALAALNCSGALLGSLPIRVSPSKTPVKVEGSRESDDQSSCASQQSLPQSLPVPQQQSRPQQQPQEPAQEQSATD